MYISIYKVNIPWYSNRTRSGKLRGLGSAIIPTVENCETRWDIRKEDGGGKPEKLRTKENKIDEFCGIRGERAGFASVSATDGKDDVAFRRRCG